MYTKKENKLNCDLLCTLTCYLWCSLLLLTLHHIVHVALPPSEQKQINKSALINVLCHTGQYIEEIIKKKNQ